MSAVFCFSASARKSKHDGRGGRGGRWQHSGHQDLQSERRRATSVPRSCRRYGWSQFSRLALDAFKMSSFKQLLQKRCQLCSIDGEVPPIKHGESITDRRSTFQPHLAPVVTPGQVKHTLLLFGWIYISEHAAQKTGGTQKGADYRETLSPALQMTQSRPKSFHPPETLGCFADTGVLQRADEPPASLPLCVWFSRG